MDLQPLLPKTRPLLERFLHTEGAAGSAYSFITHFFWQDHFSFHWTVHRDHFLLFAAYDRCLYMPLPPLGPPDREIVLDCFAWMDQTNPDRAISRIENIPEAAAGFYRAGGFVVAPKDPEYLYRRTDLAELKGDRYKSQRALCNRFEKIFRPNDRPYTPADEAGARALFQKWSADRKAKHPDPIYHFMLQDAESVHQRALAEADSLGLTGRVVETAGAIAGYTFGFPLNPMTFCILLEVADPKMKGAAAYLFHAFARSLTDFESINAMDDSGIPSLRKTKEAYRPIQKLGVYLARRA